MELRVLRPKPAYDGEVRVGACAQSDATDQEPPPNPLREETKSNSEKAFYTARRDTLLEL